jgi:hypothetical protein
MLVSTVREARQVDELIVNTPDILSSRPLVSSSVDEGLKLVQIVTSNYLGHSHDLSDMLGHSQLVEGEVRVGSNDRTS